VAKAFGGLGVIAGLAADRTSMTGMVAGQQFFETDNKIMYLYDGSAWVLSVTGTPIMFSAYGLANYTVANGAEFVFNTVVTNVGGGYNSSTGRFTAPINGYYMFHYSFLSTNNANAVDTRLRVNGSTLLAAAYSGDSVSSYKSGGASAGTFLTAGQYVSVIAFNTAYNHPDAGHEVFSGNLVR